MPTWRRFIRHGTEPTMSELAEFRFIDDLTESGPVTGDEVISRLGANSIQWSNDNKSTSPTWTNDNKSA